MQRSTFVRETILTTSQAHKAFMLRSYGITGRPQRFPPSPSTASTTVAASDPHVAQLNKFPKPPGLAGSIWATPSVPSTTSTTIVAGSTSLTVSQRQAERPSTLPHQIQPTSHSRVTSTIASGVDSITTETTRSPQESSSVSHKPSAKRKPSGSGVPVSPSVRQGKTTVTGSLSRKTNPTHDDFELIEHDDEFDVLDNEGPSAANGIKDPNVVVDGAFSTGCADDE